MKVDLELNKEQNTKQKKVNKTEEIDPQKANKMFNGRLKNLPNSWLVLICL